jgi:hypothetical protein
MRTKSAERIKAEKYIAKNPNATASELRLKCGVSLVTAYKVLEETSRSSQHEFKSQDHTIGFIINPQEGKFKEKIKGLSGNFYEAIDSTPPRIHEMPFSVEEVLQEAKEDAVNHPPHYKTGGIEVIDFIEAKGFNYRLGNVVKYVSRASHKGNYIQDLEKAKWYLEREISKAKDES